MLKMITISVVTISDIHYRENGNGALGGIWAIDKKKYFERKQIMQNVMVLLYWNKYQVYAIEPIFMVKDKKKRAA